MSAISATQMTTAVAPRIDALDDSATAARGIGRLLIVDDISDNREILSRRFQRRGFDVVEVDSGLKALEILDREQFDLVLLDVMMPEVDGLEVLRRIRTRKSRSELPVIMVTAKSESDNIVDALELGANDYVTKPVDFAIALARVSAQIERKRAEEEKAGAYAELHETNKQLEQRVSERTARLLESNRKLAAEIAHREESDARSQYLAYHDSLTGLGNRLLFKEQLEQAIAEGANIQSSLAVLFIDLDGFKSINDTLGHSIGDLLLNSIASRLRDALQETDRIARFGGDEFAILQSTGQQPQNAIALASSIIDLVGSPCVIEGHQITVGASIGIVTEQADKCDPDDLMKSADLAMYRAKLDGRGTYRVFDLEMDTLAQARRLLEINLRNAFVHNEFSLVYQPLVSLNTGRVSAFETLLRWHHPQRGNISPAVFIPVAEEMGLIVQLGEWVLRQACAEAATWPEEIRVAVNLSPAQFSKGNLVSAVINALAAAGLSPDRLELEITESVLLEKSDHNFAVLDQLHALGVRISMDDFGTGYSSLSYLHRFPFNKIKIDKSFIDNIATKPQSTAIVRAIIEMAKAFGISTTAEGVETSAQLAELRVLGCTDIQGYLFSKAEPPDCVPALLTRRMSADGSDGSTCGLSLVGGDLISDDIGSGIRVSRS